VADKFTIRCPVCLANNSVNKNISVNKIINCISCKRNFEFKNALPVKNAQQDKIVSSQAIDEIKIEANLGPIAWIVSLISILLISLIIREYVEDFEGPKFLVFYFIFFIVIYLISTFSRWYWKDCIAVSVVGLIAFEVPAMIRYFDATNNGMENFTVMIVTMLVGGIIFFLRAQHLKDTGDFFGDCSSCSGGGCGGGCGGCGG